MSEHQAKMAAIGRVLSHMQDVELNLWKQLNEIADSFGTSRRFQETNIQLFIRLSELDSKPSVQDEIPTTTRGSRTL